METAPCEFMLASTATFHPLVRIRPEHDSPVSLVSTPDNRPTEASRGLAPLPGLRSHKPQRLCGRCHGWDVPEIAAVTPYRIVSVVPGLPCGLSEITPCFQMRADLHPLAWCHLKTAHTKPEGGLTLGNESRV